MRPEIRRLGKGLILLDRKTTSWIRHRLPLLGPSFFADSGFRKVMKRIAPACRGMLVDVGCGQMRFRSHFANVRYLGMDFPETRLEMNYSATPHVWGDAHALPFKEGAVDWILASEVLEHLNDPAVALRDMHRVLNRRGGLILTTPFFYQIHSPIHDFRRFTRHGLEHLLSSTGFDVEEIVPISGYVSTLWARFGNWLHAYAWESMGRLGLVVRLFIRPLTYGVCLIGNIGTLVLDRALPNDRICSNYVTVAKKRMEHRPACKRHRRVQPSHHLYGAKKSL